jgi:hypothetical protein
MTSNRNSLINKCSTCKTLKTLCGAVIFFFKPLSYILICWCSPQNYGVLPGNFSPLVTAIGL